MRPVPAFCDPKEATGWAAGGEWSGFRVQPARGESLAGRLIITTGPWAAELLRDCDFPLQVERVVNGYFDPARPDWWPADNSAPDFLLTVPEGSFYGMPAVGNTAPTTARIPGYCAALPPSDCPAQECIRTICQRNPSRIVSPTRQSIVM